MSAESSFMSRQKREAQEAEAAKAQEEKHLTTIAAKGLDKEVDTLAAKAAAEPQNHYDEFFEVARRIALEIREARFAIKYVCRRFGIATTGRVHERLDIGQSSPHATSDAVKDLKDALLERFAEGYVSLKQAIDTTGKVGAEVRQAADNVQAGDKE